MTVGEVIGRRALGLLPLRALFSALRPKQWVKNLLVFAAPLAGGVLTRPHVLTGATVALAVFTAAAAGGYLLNDVNDAARDRAHPDKQRRPVASGALSATAATVAGGMLSVLAPGVAIADHRPGLALVVFVYSVLTLLYGVWLKRVPRLELLVLSTGFVLRPLAGAVATGVPPSPWFLAVCCLAALTIAAGKRQVEMSRLGAGARAHRPALAGYTISGLRRFRLTTLGLMLVAYAGWAVTRTTAGDRALGLVSLVPVVAAMTRLAALNSSGAGDAPEVLLLQDRAIQVAVAAWIVVFVFGLGRL